MSFGTNVSYYRKKYGITQEDLADKLDVTRQTVSRWETDAAYPEMDKIITLCSIFSCSMDVLMRGDAQKEDEAEKKQLPVEPETSKADYDKHMNCFSLLCALGASFMIIGVGLMILFEGLSLRRFWGMIFWFSLVTVGGSFLVAGCIMHARFLKDCGKIQRYTKEEVHAYYRKTPVWYAIGTSLLIIGILVFFIMTFMEWDRPEKYSVDEWMTVASGIMLFFVSISVFIFVFFKIRSQKYSSKRILVEDETGAISEKKCTAKIICNGICIAIMIAALSVFLYAGFVSGTWHPAWVVFIIFGALCGVCIAITEVIERKSK